MIESELVDSATDGVCRVVEVGDGDGTGVDDGVLRGEAEMSSVLLCVSECDSDFVRPVPTGKLGHTGHGTHGIKGSDGAAIGPPDVKASPPQHAKGAATEVPFAHDAFADVTTGSMLLPRHAVATTSLRSKLDTTPDTALANVTAEAVA